MASENEDVAFEELRGALEFARRDLQTWEREKQGEIGTIRTKAEASLSSAQQELEALQAQVGRHKDAVAKAREAAMTETRLAEAEAQVLSLRQQVEKQSKGDLRRNADFFRCLGLDLQGAGDGALKLRFTLLDKREPQREFAIVVVVDENDMYGVATTAPALPDDVIQSELLQVNQTNDFSRFVINIRRHFLALCA